MAKGQKTGGRTKGVPNKATKDIKELARALAPEATKRLQELLTSDNESVSLGAVKEIFDRAYGKASQVIAGDADNPITWQEIRRTIVRPGHSDR